MRELIESKQLQIEQRSMQKKGQKMQERVEKEEGEKGRKDASSFSSTFSDASKKLKESKKSKIKENEKKEFENPKNKKNKLKEKLERDLGFQMLQMMQKHKRSTKLEAFNFEQAQEKMTKNHSYVFQSQLLRKNQDENQTLFMKEHLINKDVSQGNEKVSIMEETALLNSIETQAKMNKKTRATEMWKKFQQLEKNSEQKNKTALETSLKSEMKAEQAEQKGSMQIDETFMQESFDLLDAKPKQKLNLKQDFAFMAGKEKIENRLNFEQKTNFQHMKTQLQDTISYMSKQNKQQVVMKLNPEYLGKLNIHISLLQDSKTKVEIKAQKIEALQLLSDHQAQLKDLFSAIKKVEASNEANNEVSFSFNQEDQASSQSEQGASKNKKHQLYQEEKFNYSEEESIRSYAGLIEVIV